jgi:hypothetical protein
MDRLAPPHYSGDAGPCLSHHPAQNRSGEKNQDHQLQSLSRCDWTCCRSRCPNCAGCSGVCCGRARPTPHASSPGRYGGGAISNAPAAVIGIGEHISINSSCSTSGTTHFLVANLSRRRESALHKIPLFPWTVFSRPYFRPLISARPFRCQVLLLVIDPEWNM